jgi:hypothetical protein
MYTSNELLVPLSDMLRAVRMKRIAKGSSEVNTEDTFSMLYIYI